MEPPSLTLFSWASGDTIVLAPKTPPAAHQGLAVAKGGEWELGEVRLHRPWGLWRHSKGIQLPFQVFFGEAQSVWSQATSRAAAGGMHDSSLEERRVLLPAEVHDYKELYFQLMRRVARFTDELSSSSSSSSPPSEEELRTDISDFQSLCELLYRGHQAWHLAHIVIKHLVPQPRGRSSDLPFDLVHWVQEHDPLDLYTDVKLQTRCAPFDQGSQQPSQEWWTVLYRYAMHCWVDQACDMIQELIDEHPGRLGGGVQEALVAAQAILEGLTVSEDAADMAQPVEGALREWSSMEEWHIVESWSVGGGLLAKELGVLMRIMRGSMDDITAHAKTWVQSVAAQMMYRRSDNKLGVADLANVVEDVLVQWGDSAATTPGGEDHESVIKALMRLDMQAAVQCFSTCLHDWWSAAHLADILYRGNFLPFSQQFASDLRHFSIRYYIDLLLSSNGLWQIASGYARGAVECDFAEDDVGAVGGKQRWRQRKSEMMCIVADMVTRQRISWDKGRRRLLQACPENAVGTCYDPKSGAASLQNLWNRHELAVIGGGASREIQVAWGMRLLSQGREAAALHWLSRGRSPLVQELANKTLMSYVTASEPVGMQKMEPLLKYVDSGGSDELITSSTRGDTAVILVRNFFRIRKLLEQRGGGDDRRFEAANLLRAMLDPSSHTPRQFWPELLSYTVPLMEAGGGTTLFSSDDIIHFLQVLQDVAESRKTPAIKDRAGVLRLQATRLALARGLSAAYQAEAR